MEETSGDIPIDPGADGKALCATGGSDDWLLSRVRTAGGLEGQAAEQTDVTEETGVCICSRSEGAASRSRLDLPAASCTQVAGGLASADTCPRRTSLVQFAESADCEVGATREHIADRSTRSRREDKSGVCCLLPTALARYGRHVACGTCLTARYLTLQRNASAS